MNWRRSRIRLDISDEDIQEATEALRSIVIGCENPVTVRTFLGTFVERVVLESDRAVIEYNPAKIMNHGTCVTVVHSRNTWLPDLDSNQGPAD